jgi:hypothetical protein
VRGREIEQEKYSGTHVMAFGVAWFILCNVQSRFATTSIFGVDRPSNHLCRWLCADGSRTTVGLWDGRDVWQSIHRGRKQKDE